MDVDAVGAAVEHRRVQLDQLEQRRVDVGGDVLRQAVPSACAAPGRPRGGSSVRAWCRSFRGAWLMYRTDGTVPRSVTTPSRGSAVSVPRAKRRVRSCRVRLGLQVPVWIRRPVARSRWPPARRGHGNHFGSSVLTHCRLIAPRRPRPANNTGVTRAKQLISSERAHVKSYKARSERIRPVNRRASEIATPSVSVNRPCQVVNASVPGECDRGRVGRRWS